MLNFDHGVTAVVGPNGSGKSNISDAMRWVLGEISSKSMRGAKMEDVIFGGTDDRRPMGFCEVSLTIDNTDPENKMAIDYDEVTVTRRYYRSGESEYFINRSPVRLKDITELFMNTGIGRTGYSMVGQGKAAEIISQKSDERRIIFEEAAGIAKYRYKKNEAERKLGHVEENLVRIGDIIGELESRVGPLEKEAEKARKYLEVYEQKKSSEVALTIFDISNIKSRQTVLERDFSAAQLELESADDEIRRNEQKTEKLFEQVQRDKLRYEELFRLTGEANEERLNIETSGKVYENEISHVTEQRAEASARVSLLETELVKAREARELCTKTLEDEKEKLLAAVRKNEEATAAVAEKDGQIDAESAKIEEYTLALADLNGELVDKRIELTTLEVSDRSGDERKTALSGEVEELEASIKTISDRIAKADETVAAYNSNASDVTASLDAMRAEEERLAQALSRDSEEVNALSVEVDSLEHRAQNLERMEAQLEGYSHSVRRVINAAGSGELTGICGPVSQIITTPQKYAAAIESALGATMQNVVVETEADAKRAIHFLRDNKAGRATFYPVSTVKPSYLNGKEYKFESYAGFIGMAHDVAECDDKYRGVVDYLLCRTVVFDDLDHATEMARSTGFKVRAVTLDGQLINTGGSFTGGSAIRESGMLTRHNDIARIRSDIKKRRAELDRAIKQRREDEALLEAKRSEIADVSAKTSIFASLVSAENAQRRMLEAQLETDNARLETLRLSISGIDEDIERAKAAYAETCARISALEAEIAATQKSLDDATENRRVITAAQEELRREANALLLEITASRKDAESAEAALADANARVGETEAAIEEARAAILSCEEKMAEFMRKKDEGGNASREIAARIKAYEDESREISERNQQNEMISTGLREENKSLQQRREVIFRNYTKLENERVNVASEQDKLTAHLWEEYELTYSAAVELGLPPVTEENRKSVYAAVSELRGKLRQMGPVNVGAIEEYAEVRERYDFMKGQFDDLTQSRTELGGVIFKLEKEMRERFIGVFEQINKNFKSVFTELFGGGSASISLTDPDNVLTSGIEIEVAPPGKIIKNLSLLSGGEQAFVAIALFFAILKVNPTPFCVLDEIEAALDEVNVARFAEYCRKYSDRTQFIIITHRRGSMEAADMLYGVTMYERGISKVLSVNVNDVEKKIGVKL